MKIQAVAATLFLVNFCGQALAQPPGVPQCEKNPIPPDIGNAFFNDRLLCALGRGPNQGDKWQEIHRENGNLVEYARGPDDPIDPSRKVGSWERGAAPGPGPGDGEILSLTHTYDHDANSPYTWYLFLNNPDCLDDPDIRCVATFCNAVVNGTGVAIGTFVDAAASGCGGRGIPGFP
jgi:hypothetical protein